MGVTIVVIVIVLIIIFYSRSSGKSKSGATKINSKSKSFDSKEIRNTKILKPYRNKKVKLEFLGKSYTDLMQMTGFEIFTLVESVNGDEIGIHKFYNDQVQEKVGHVSKNADRVRLTLESFPNNFAVFDELDSRYSKKIKPEKISNSSSIIAYLGFEVSKLVKHKSLFERRLDLRSQYLKLFERSQNYDIHYAKMKLEDPLNTQEVYKQLFFDIYMFNEDVASFIEDNKSYVTIDRSKPFLINGFFMKAPLNRLTVLLSLNKQYQELIEICQSLDYEKIFLSASEKKAIDKRITVAKMKTEV